MLKLQPRAEFRWRSRTSCQFLRPASPIPSSVAKLSPDAELVCSQNYHCQVFFNFISINITFLQMVPVWPQSRQQPATCLLPLSTRPDRQPTSLSPPLQVSFRSSFKNEKIRSSKLCYHSREDISILFQKNSNFTHSSFHRLFWKPQIIIFHENHLCFLFPDNAMRFRRCTRSSSGSSKYEWREWSMISDNKPSELDVDGRRI